MKMYEILDEGAAPKAVKKLMAGHTYKCKDCGDTMHKPTSGCKHDAHDEMGSWWKDENGNGIPDVMEESKDAYCSDKCCGADVKAEDCKCPPTCKHCNCNSVSETTTAGAIATSMGNGNGFANGGPGVVKRTKKARNKTSKR